MQFKLIALLTLIAASVNGAVLNKRSGESSVYSPTRSWGTNAGFQSRAYVLVGPILPPIPSLRSTRDELVASSDGK